MKSAKLRAEKGLIEVELSLENQVINSLQITGDFFIHPEEALEEIERTLIGSTTKESELKEKLVQLFKEKGITSPGITADDFTRAILLAINQ